MMIHPEPIVAISHGYIKLKLLVHHIVRVKLKDLFYLICDDHYSMSN